MKKWLFFGFLVLGWTLLAACSAATATPAIGAAEPPADATFAPADDSMALPEIGFVSVIQSKTIKAVLLRSQPDVKSDIAGRVEPGDLGELLGRDESGQWALVTINGQTGWIPVELVKITYEQ